MELKSRSRRRAKGGFFGRSGGFGGLDGASGSAWGLDACVRGVAVEGCSGDGEGVWLLSCICGAFGFGLGLWWSGVTAAGVGPVSGCAGDGCGGILACAGVGAIGLGGLCGSIAR